MIYRHLIIKPRSEIQWPIVSIILAIVIMLGAVGMFLGGV